MKRYVNISSIEYDKAESVAFAHAVMLPVVIAAITAVFYDEYTAIISALTYTLILTVANLFRLISTKDTLEQFKSEAYFEGLKYFFGLIVLVALYKTLTIVMVGA